MRYYSIKGVAMRKMEENMGIFKDDEEKTTENVSLPEVHYLMRTRRTMQMIMWIRIC